MFAKLSGGVSGGVGHLLASWRVRTGVALALSAMLLLAGIIEYDRSDHEERAYIYLLRTNSWVAAQLELELLRFLASVDALVLGQEDVSHDDAMLRFDILWSRVPVFLRGPEAATARSIDGTLETVLLLQKALVRIEPTVAALRPGDTVGRAAITGALAPFVDPIHAITLEVSIGESRRRLVDSLNIIRHRHSLLALLIAGGTTLLVAFLLAEIYRSQRQTERERQARKSATVANETKSRFLANMSHELRTPLNAVIGFAELIQTQCFGPLGSPHYKEYVDDIASSGKHLLSVVSDILDAARVETGEMQLHEEVFSTAEVIGSSLRMLRSLAQAKRIEVSTRLAQESPWLRADARLFRQICLNLVGNSLKFCEPGSHVEVATRLTEEGFVLTVDDDGPGIAGRDLAQITKPFFQCDDNLNRRHEGSGLGLSLTKAFAELHGGRLEVESAPGQGTRISVVFPASRLAQAT